MHCITTLVTMPPDCMGCGKQLKPQEMHYVLREETVRWQATGDHKKRRHWEQWLCCRCSLLYDMTRTNVFDLGQDSANECGLCGEVLASRKPLLRLSLRVEPEGGQLGSGNCCTRCMKYRALDEIWLLQSPNLTLRCETCGQFVPASIMTTTSSQMTTKPWDPYEVLPDGQEFCCMNCMCGEWDIEED